MGLSGRLRHTVDIHYDGQGLARIGSQQTRTFDFKTSVLHCTMQPKTLELEAKYVDALATRAHTTICLEDTHAAVHNTTKVLELFVTLHQPLLKDNAPTLLTPK